VLSLTTVSVTAIFSYFSYQERLNLVDKRIRSLALSLVNSELGKIREVNFEIADQLISRELGEERIGKLFIMRNKSDEILYQSATAALLHSEIPREQQWVSIEAEGRFIRVLNLDLPEWPDRFLQVGLIMEPGFKQWHIISPRLAACIALVFLFVLGISAGLTAVLFSPIRQLKTHFEALTSSLNRQRELEPLPIAFAPYREASWSQSDEFSRLVGVVEQLIDRINANYKMTRSWSLQMAHELKTPLTILRAEVERQTAKGPLGNEASESMLAEIEKVSETVSLFLDWADLENSNRERHSIHAVHLDSLVLDTKRRMDLLFPDRVTVKVDGESLVLASPLHVDQLVNNLVVNSLKFSPEKETVSVEVRERELIVEDKGPGIPKQVIERLGQPFNFGQNTYQSKSRGSGLGLAWVKTITRIYGWDLDIQTTGQGTKIRIVFPPLTEA
jgi:two-component system sensor histidine kinase QseC